MTYEEKSEIVIRQLREDRDRLLDAIDKIRAEVADAQLIGYATINGKREIASKAVMEIIDKYREEQTDAT